MAYRVVQWTTGNVGRRALRAIVAHPELDLVGCYAWSPEKVGRDAGELAGIDALGVSATDDIEALLALEPDCLCYTPVWPDPSELVRFLEVGVDVVTTSAFVTGRGYGADARRRIEEACLRGQSSIFGSGMNPGFANLLGLVSAGICDRIDSISVLESVDSTGYASGETEQSVGYGRRPDDPGLPALVEQGTAVFGDGVELMADALGVELDEIVCEAEFAVTTEDLELPGDWRIEAGCVAGVAASWQGRVAGRTVIDLQVRWRKGQTLEPDWPVEHGYLVRVEGQPCVKTKLEIRPPKDFQARSFEDFMQLGMIMTALPAVNAIPAVCEAKPGVRTYVDLPLVTGRGFVSGGTPLRST
jgi:hypothetical protein